MESDPLYQVKQLFYQASYKACISEATSQGITPSSDPSSLHRAIYVARSHLSLSPPSPESASSAIKPFLSDSASASPAAKAVDSFIRYFEAKDESVVDELRDLVIETEGSEEGEKSIEEGFVRTLAGTVFILQGENEEAVATLTEGAAKTDIECNAVLVQLLLSLDRRDLAQTTYQNVKKFGNDNILVQAMEAWIGLKTGSRPLHQSYYFYEELYQLPSGRTPPVLASHAAAHLLLGHLDEAKADIAEAMNGGGEKDASVLAVAASLGTDGAVEKLTSTAPEHPYALDLAEKSKAFDEAASKFSIAA